MSLIEVPENTDDTGLQEAPDVPHYVREFATEHPLVVNNCNSGAQATSCRTVSSWTPYECLFLVFTSILHI
jgi:hypothetical protein